MCLLVVECVAVVREVGVASSGNRRRVYGVWCVVCDVWCVVCGVWCAVCGGR